jgi:membrane protease YdiL (CAAX protease family)
MLKVEGESPLGSLVSLGALLLMILVVVSGLQFAFPGWLVGSVLIPAATGSMALICVCWARYRLGIADWSSLFPRGRFAVVQSAAAGVFIGLTWSAVSSIYFLGVDWIGEPIPWRRIAILPFAPIALSTILFTPIWEELYFRRLVFQTAVSRSPLVVALVVQASVSSLLHFDIPGVVSVDWIVYRFAVALLLAYVYSWSGSIFASIGCHSAINWWSTIAISS